MDRRRVRQTQTGIEMDKEIGEVLVNALSGTGPDNARTGELKIEER